MGSNSICSMAGRYRDGIRSSSSSYEVYEIGMRAGALTLIILVATWMMPVGGSTCPSAKKSPSHHSHARSNDSAAHSHHHAAPPHTDGAVGAEAHSHTGSMPVGDGSTCCKQRASDAVVLQPALQDAKPRTKVSMPVPVWIVVSPPAATWFAAGEIQHQPPPPRPYARTRRPLLI
jgi:hypothetical protein